jgi:hypothetical protein
VNSVGDLTRATDWRSPRTPLSGCHLTPMVALLAAAVRKPLRKKLQHLDHSTSRSGSARGEAQDDLGKSHKAMERTRFADRRTTDLVETSAHPYFCWHEIS